MPLLIIESPNKIKKLQSILGNTYAVLATVGHFMKLSKKDMGIGPDFEPNYVIDPKKRDVVNRIKAEAKNHKDIYIATDPDREGEGIAKHIYDMLPKKGKKIKRVRFNAITKSAVKDAIKNCGDIDLNLYNAQKARRITDRIVGYKVSPVMWKKGLAGTSAGRVQSVALDYISSREKEVRAFKPDEYWSINSDLGDFTIELKKIDGKDFKLLKSDAQKIKKDLEGKSIKVLSVSSRKRTVSTKPPFKTSTLQQEASSLFGWKSSKTMDVAQSLFGMGMITYHRTDSERTDPQKLSSLRKNVEKFYGKNYLKNPAPSYGSSAGAQDAHEAIRPTYETVTQPLNLNEKKLLDLISSRFKASQMADAIYDSVKAEFKIKAKGKEYLFVVNGSSLDFDGFLKVYGSKKDDKLLPKMKKGEAFTMSKVNANQHFTKAPPRYTDASLIKKLEKEGVGRPSTYATIIKTLEDREYIKRSGKALEATEVGIIVQEFLSGRLPDLVDSKFTSSMEESLDKLADGSANYIDVMNSFSTTLGSALEKAIQNPLPDTLICDDSECPKCTSKMIKKISKHGPFLACTEWPKCNGTLKIDGSGQSDVQLETGKECPKCSNILVKRKGKGGEFLGCKSFPECKHAEPIVDENTVMCDKCNSPMAKRKGRYGFFLGCSAYPKCKNIINIKKTK